MVGSVNNPIQQYVSPYLRTDQNTTVAPSQSSSLSRPQSGSNSLAASGGSSQSASAGRGSLIDITV